MKSIKEQLAEEKYSFVSETDKDFIDAFAFRMSQLGYTCKDKIVNGICWGKYMLVFTKENVRSEKVYARIYIRDDCIVLRLFFTAVSSHSAYIEATPDFIKESFVGVSGTCSHCKGDGCRFRKSYEIAGVQYEKCNGVTFEFPGPVVNNLDEYINLFTEFYPIKLNKGGQNNEREA